MCMYVFMPLGLVPEVLREGCALCKPPSVTLTFSFNNCNKGTKGAFIRNNSKIVVSLFSWKKIAVDFSVRLFFPLTIHWIVVEKIKFGATKTTLRKQRATSVSLLQSAVILALNHL